MGDARGPLGRGRAPTTSRAARADGRRAVGTRAAPTSRASTTSTTSCAPAPGAADELPFDFNGGFVGYLGYELKAECGGEHAHCSPLPGRGAAVRRPAASPSTTASGASTSSRSPTPTRRRRRGSTSWRRGWRRSRSEPATRRRPRRRPTAAGARRGRRRLAGCAAPATRRRLPRRHRRRCQQRDRRRARRYEICLTNAVALRAGDRAVAPTGALRARQPGAVRGFPALRRRRGAQLSPERFLRVDRDGTVEAKPIKGTAARAARRRPRTRAAPSELRASAKDRAENLMIVDLLRNDLGARLRGRQRPRAGADGRRDATRRSTSSSRPCAAGCAEDARRDRLRARVRSPAAR